MDRRRVKIGSKPHLHQVSSDFIDNTDEERSALVSSSSSGIFKKSRVKVSILLTKMLYLKGLKVEIRKDELFRMRLYI